MSVTSRGSRRKSWQNGRQRVSVLAALAIHKETVSKKLSELREAHADSQTGKPLSQEKAAARVGVTMRQWQRWESGESVPYPRNLDAIAAEFDFDVAEFFEEGTPPAKPSTPDPFADATGERLARMEAQLVKNGRLLNALLIQLLGDDEETMRHLEIAAEQVALEAQDATDARPEPPPTPAPDNARNGPPSPA